jgi:acyl-CoA synthetase (AMP-forming)/AMP-acid ligase II
MTTFNMETPIAYDSLCLGALPARHARYRPRHTAVVAAGAKPGGREIRFDWRELNAYVNRWASALADLGVARGDRVATVLGNGPELLATYWACAKLGAVAVPLSPLLTTTGLISLLDDAPPKVVVAAHDVHIDFEAVRSASATHATWVLIDAAADDESAGYRSFGLLHASASDAEPQARVEAGDLLTLMYTSGTTGMPKGIQHTHFIRAMYATTMANAWRMAPESVVLHTGALVFNGAMVTMFPAFMCGATFIVHRAFDPEAFIDTVERERVTHTMLVPSQIIAILNATGFDPARLTSLEIMLSLGAPLHSEYKDRLNRLLPDRFYELYGLTEGFVTILDRADAQRKSGSVGIPPPFYSMRIVGEDGHDLPAGAVGEIIGRGPITMRGYHQRPELAVREVAVFGIPHDKWGETPVAAVVLCEGERVDGEALKAWINARVAARYQRVDRVLVLADFPRNAAGKTLKRALRAPFWKGRERSI